MFNRSLKFHVTDQSQHFIFIADAMTYMSGDNELSLWNEEDGMYYDVIQFGPGDAIQLPVRSLVGLIPLYATLVLEPAVLKRFPGFRKRMEWFIDHRPEVSARNMANMKGNVMGPSLTFDFLLFYSHWQGRTTSSCACQQGEACAYPGEDVRRGGVPE